MRPFPLWERKVSKTHPGATEYSSDVVQPTLAFISPGRFLPTSLWLVEDESSRDHPSSG